MSVPVCDRNWLGLSRRGGTPQARRQQANERDSGARKVTPRSTDPIAPRLKPGNPSRYRTPLRSSGRSAPTSRRQGPMGFRYTLSTPDGELFGEAEYTFQPQARDEIYVAGNRRMPVTAVVPTPRIEEFVERRALYGVLEVELVE